MNLNTALLILITGALTGFISGLMARTRGRGFGFPVHLIVGIIGAFHGRLLFGLLDIHASGTIGHLVFAAVGAVLILNPLRWIRPA